MNIKQLVYRAFTRKYGIVLHPEATEFVVAFITRHELSTADAEALLEQLAAKCSTLADADEVLDQPGMKKLFQLLISDTTTQGTAPESSSQGPMSMDVELAPDCTPMDLLQVVGAFDMPYWTFDESQGRCVIQQRSSHCLGDEIAKTAMYNDRAMLLRQRVLRHPRFHSNTFHQSGANRESVQLLSVNSLRGRAGERFTLFGMLSQLNEGQLSLEERSGSVPLDITECETDLGIFVENMFVLAEGALLDDGVFKVARLCMPPTEDKSLTRKWLGDMELLGFSLDNPAYVTKAEKHFTDVSIVFLSDLHLDVPGTLSRLRELFDGYNRASSIPTAFVMMGSFSSRPFQPGSGGSEAYKENLNQLADAIAQCRELRENSLFVFVPGPNDPWSGGDTLPQRPLPETFTDRLRTRLRQTIFTTNPCRLRYATQDFVIFRCNLLARMRRHCVRTVSSSKESLVHQLMNTIFAQGHLVPMPLYRQPIFWQADHALRLYQAPDLLVLGDQTSPYALVQDGCQCLNPGSFTSNAHSWYVYRPATRTAEFSSLSAR